MRLNTAVEEACWDNVEKKWKTTVQVSGEKDREFAGSYTITSDFLVSAVGQLNVPQYPAIPGMDDFNGKTMHSARWDWSYDLQGKRIAVIGNGKAVWKGVNPFLTARQARARFNSSPKSQRSLRRSLFISARLTGCFLGTTS